MKKQSATNFLADLLYVVIRIKDVKIDILVNFAKSFIKFSEFYLEKQIFSLIKLNKSLRFYINYCKLTNLIIKN